MSDEITPFIVAEHLHSPLMVAEYLAAAVDGDIEPTPGELRAYMAEAIAALKRLHDERDEEDALRERMASLLTGTANALKGEPDPRMSHSWHDLADWSRALRNVAMLYLAATAPGSGEAERLQFHEAINAWRTLFGRDLMETAEALTLLDKTGDVP